MELVNEFILMVSSSMVGGWIVASTFSLEIIRHFESGAERRVAGGRFLIAPSGWQAVAA
ncbi:MAG: hypothetical protein ACM30I_09590 [Gemmatimonas sp.]